MCFALFCFVSCTTSFNSGLHYSTPFTAPPCYSVLFCCIILYLLPSLSPIFREGVATRELARLYRDNGAVDKAAECYYHHLLLTGGGALVTAVQKVILGVCVCVCVCVYVGICITTYFAFLLHLLLLFFKLFIKPFPLNSNSFTPHYRFLCHLLLFCLFFSFPNLLYSRSLLNSCCYFFCFYSASTSPTIFLFLSFPLFPSFFILSLLSSLPSPHLSLPMYSFVFPFLIPFFFSFIISISSSCCIPIPICHTNPFPTSYFTLLLSLPSFSCFISPPFFFIRHYYLLLFLLPFCSSCLFLLFPPYPSFYFLSFLHPISFTISFFLTTSSLLGLSYLNLNLHSPLFFYFLESYSIVFFTFLYPGRFPPISLFLD